MRLKALLLTLAATGLLATGAHAYEPESGLWWNPAESGTGFTIDLQDDFMAVTIYGGGSNGEAKWYLAANRLDGNAYFEADLLAFSGVQPIGQPWHGEGIPESIGRLKIVFDPDDNRRATLTWPNGRSIPIERQEFYFVRPEDRAGVQSDTTRQLGEWQVSIDLSQSDADYPYSGDVLVFDDYGEDELGWFYEGCRPDNAQVGGCSSYALNNHDSVGFFEVPTGLHITLVKDGVFNGRMWYALYTMKMGTNDGSGDFILYPEGGDPDQRASYPARTFRSASRTFVQEGVGPAKRNSVGNAGGLAAQLAAQGVVLEPNGKSGRSETGSRVDLKALAPRIRVLEQRLQGR